LFFLPVIFFLKSVFLAPFFRLERLFAILLVCVDFILKNYLSQLLCASCQE
jgi:hypothetical protein